MLKNFLIFAFLAEFACFWAFASEFGILVLILEIILSAVFGLSLIFRGGVLNFGANLTSFFSLNNALGSAFGGFLLFLPGLITDVVGAIFVILSLFGSRGKSSGFYYEERNFNAKNGDEVIDVEVIDERRSLR